MTDLLTLERAIFVFAVLAAFGSGLWVGDDGEKATETKVAHRSSVFSEQDAYFEPLDKLILWKEPDSTEVKEEQVVIPNWFAQMPEVVRDTVVMDGEVGVDVPSFPGYVAMPLQGGDPPVRFNDGRALISAADPRTGRMMELGVELPEDTWRGYLTAVSVAGRQMFFGVGTFDVEKKTSLGLVGLGIGGAAAVVDDKAAAGVVGKVTYRKKLF